LRQEHLKNNLKPNGNSGAREDVII